jgi:hypothetical protein
MPVSKKCKLCSIFIIVDEEGELDEAVESHKESHYHKSKKEEAETEREVKERAKRDELLKKYYPNQHKQWEQENYGKKDHTTD